MRRRAPGSNKRVSLCDWVEADKNVRCWMVKASHLIFREIKKNSVFIEVLYLCPADVIHTPVSSSSFCFQIVFYHFYRSALQSHTGGFYGLVT